MDQIIQLISSLVPSAVAIVAIIWTRRNLVKQLDHQQEQDRQKRLWEKRAQAYLDCLALLYSEAPESVRNARNLEDQRKPRADWPDAPRVLAQLVTFGSAEVGRLARDVLGHEDFDTPYKADQLRELVRQELGVSLM